MIKEAETEKKTLNLESGTFTKVQEKKMAEKIEKEGEIGMEPEIHDMCQTY